MAKICVLQHAEPETPGILTDILAARGIELNHVRSYLAEPVPRRMDGYDGLLVMGGPMGVYEADRYPWLRDELALVEAAVAAEKPVLGICLGSQIVAAALGAQVSRGRREVGWLPLTLTPAASDDPLWRDVERTFTPMHWHGDVFDLPRGAVALASSAMTPHQAFRFGSNVYAFLFHMELTVEMVRGMVRAFPGDIVEAGADGDAILARSPAAVPEIHKIARTVFERWARLFVLEPA
jgi:GMP synthase (glutamine-hydrolysing)